MSPGFGPASIASMASSVICWIVGRRPSTRLKVNGFDSIRRNRVCSSPSAVKTDRGRLCTVDSMPSFQCGKPGRRSSTLTRESENSVARLFVAGDEPWRAAVPDPDPGQRPRLGQRHHVRRRGERAAGWRVPSDSRGCRRSPRLSLPVSVSDTSHSSMWMASAGQPASALRALSACSAGGFSSSRTTTPSSSR